MFKTKHYVPMLKWKRAEQKALAELSVSTKKLITPFVSFVMPKPKIGELVAAEDSGMEELVSRFQDKIPEIPKILLSCWGTLPIFVDFSLIFTAPLKIEGLEKVMAGGANIGLHLVPATNLSDAREIQNCVISLGRKYGSGLCLRLVTSDLADMVVLKESIASFLSLSKMKPGEIDLIVDIQNIECGDDKYSVNFSKAQELPYIKEWRSFTFSSGAFPKDLSTCKLDEENHLPRLDWTSWLEGVGSKVNRLPSYSDYTIQHPIYNEATQFYFPTTSIKYTLDKTWLIMKGKKQRYGLYLANANVLIGDKDIYMGEGFSYGDKYIAEKGRHFLEYKKNPAVKGTGSTETWLAAVINHHLVYTATQIANLS